MKRTVTVRVPATTANLGPGFDVLGAALSLYNDVEVCVNGARDLPRAIVIEGEGAGMLPTGTENIFWQTMRKTFRRCGVPAETPWARFDALRIRMVNRIPLASGLGSSAAVRLAGIIAANELAGRKLSSDDIVAFGAELEGHPDNVVPAFAGGLCVSTLVDGKVAYVKLAAPNLSVVVCHPEFELSTSSARKVLPKQVPLQSAVFNLSRLALLLAALSEHRYSLLGTAMEDMLHQPHRARLVPGLFEVLGAARAAGAYGAALSGAGPAVVAFCPKSKAGAVGRNIQRKWRQFNIPSNFMALKFDTRGARVL